MDMTPNLTLIIMQMVPFLLVLFALNRIIWRPMLAHLEERDAAIEGGRQEAAALQDRIEARMVEYRERLDAAKAEVTELRAQRRGEASEEMDARIAAARAAAESEIAAAVSNINAERAQAWRQLKRSTRRLAGDIAGRVLGRG